MDEVQLPPIEKFYNTLKEEPITQQQYDHAQAVWKNNNFTTIKDYHNHYLSIDVLLLADIVENFRAICKRIYGLDVCHYISAPSLAFDAMLKYTGVELELLQDHDMYTFCEKGMRGGFSAITHRYAKANNPYLKDNDMEKPNSYIMYLDANNLYGWAMSRKMPQRGFKWDNVSYDDIMSAVKGTLLSVICNILSICMICIETFRWLRNI